MLRCVHCFAHRYTKCLWAGWDQFSIAKKKWELLPLLYSATPPTMLYRVAELCEILEAVVIIILFIHIEATYSTSLYSYCLILVLVPICGHSPNQYVLFSFFGSQGGHPCKHKYNLQTPWSCPWSHLNLEPQHCKATVHTTEPPYCPVYWVESVTEHYWFIIKNMTCTFLLW